MEQARLAQILRGVAVVVRAGVLPYDGVVDRLAVFFSQITAVSRWLVKPSASMSCSLMSSSASASLKARRVLRQISIGSCSTQPFCGMCWACSNCDWATTLPSVRVMHTRVDVVPWSIAAIKAMRVILRVGVAVPIRWLGACRVVDRGEGADLLVVADLLVAPASAWPRTSSVMSMDILDAESGHLLDVESGDLLDTESNDFLDSA